MAKAEISPKLGRTRYRSGEVVLILKAMGRLLLFVIDMVAIKPFGLFKNTSSFSGATSYSASTIMNAKCIVLD